MSKPQYAILSPDGIPIQPYSFSSRTAAEDALKRWVEQYRTQGYYSTARHERIPVDELAAHCEVEALD